MNRLLLIILNLLLATSNAQQDSTSFDVKNKIGFQLELGHNGVFLIAKDFDYTADLRNEVDIRRNQLSYFINYERRLTPRFWIQTGIRYRQLGFKTIKHQFEFDSENELPQAVTVFSKQKDPYFDGSFGWTTSPKFSDYRYVISFGESTYNIKGQIKFRYTYLEIPINLKYQLPFQWKKTSFYTKTGFSLSNLIETNYKSFINDKFRWEVKRINEKFALRGVDILGADETRYWNFGLTQGFGSNLPISPRLEMNLEVNYFLNLNDYSKSERQKEKTTDDPYPIYEFKTDNILEFQNSITASIGFSYRW